jgi:uncharacterized membrane protein (DUF485 family)
MLTDPAEAAGASAAAGQGAVAAEAETEAQTGTGTATGTGTVQAPPSPQVYRSVHGSKEFQRIRRRYRDFAFPAAVGVMVWYLLYVVLSVTAPGFMGAKLFGEVNVAFVFTVLQLVTTVTVSQLFSRQAAAKRDEAARRLRWVAQEELK